MRQIKVLMVTGAYFPEISGGGVQIRNLILALRESVSFMVLTTARAALRRSDLVDGIPVWRVPLSDDKFWQRLRAFAALLGVFISKRFQYQIVHLHGFSLKSILGILVAKAFGRRVLLTIHTAGQDDPQSQRNLLFGGVRLWAYRAVDRYVTVSPALFARSLAGGLRADRLVEIPNGVDLSRFRPPSTAAEKAAIRERLNLPRALPVILYVGFFSQDKGPHLAVEAWLRAREKGIRSCLVMAGSTDTRYFEVDGALVDMVRRLIGSEEAGGDARIIDHTLEMEAFYRAADLFVLPSVREGLPVALLEAMASGLPCVASRLPGATDAVIEDQVNGILVTPGDVEDLTRGIIEVIQDPQRGEALGRAGRASVEAHYTVKRMATAYLECYRKLAGVPCEAGRHHLRLLH